MVLTLGAEERASLIDRMSSYSVYGVYRRLESRRLPGTTQWIVEDPTFKKWLESAEKAELFLVGKGTFDSTYQGEIVTDVGSRLWQDDSDVRISPKTYAFSKLTKKPSRTSIVECALEISPPGNPVLSFFFEHPMSSAVDLFASLAQQLLRHMISAGRSISRG